MNCFYCQTEHEMNELNNQMLCGKCIRTCAGKSKKKDEIVKVLEKKKNQLKKYQAENKKYSTIAYKEAETILDQILPFFGITIKKEKILFPYIVDFYLQKAGIAFEIDGGVHDTQIAYDDRRDAWLNQAWGVTVIRFTNDDVGTRYFKKAVWEIGKNYFKDQIEKVNIIAKELRLPEYQINERYSYDYTIS